MEYLRQFLSRYRSRTAGSLAIATAAGQLADPPAPMPCHPLLAEIGYSIAAAGFEGSRFRDVDGNEYLDFSMAFGSALFGHNPDFVRTALIDQLERGCGVGPPSALAAELAAQIAQMTGMQRAHGRDQRDGVAGAAPARERAMQRREGAHDARSWGHGMLSVGYDRRCLVNNRLGGPQCARGAPYNTLTINH